MCNARRRLSVLLIGLLLCPIQVWAAAVANDTSCNSGGTTSPRTCSNTGSGSATYAVLCAGMADASDTTNGTPTYGGVNMMAVTSLQNPAVSRTIAMWVLVNPPTGTQTFSYAFTGSNRHNMIGATFTGTAQRYVNQTTASTTGSPMSMSVTATDGTNGLTLVCNVQGSGNAVTAGTGETVQQNNNGGNTSTALLTSDTNGSHAFAPTASGTPNWAGIGFSIEPNAAATTTQTLPLMGVGN